MSSTYEILDYCINSSNLKVIVNKLLVNYKKCYRIKKFKLQHRFR